MRILNLFAGLGGNRVAWKNVSVTAVERAPSIASLYQKRFPEDNVYIRDVFDFLRDFAVDKYDFIWASPPCQSHSQMQKFNKGIIPIPKLNEIYGLKIWLDRMFSGHYVIENVQPYYRALIKPNVRIGRHLFWSNFQIAPLIIQKGNNKHGKIGGIMREETSELIEYLGLHDVREDLLKIRNKEQIIRNCVDPRIGEYILNQFLQNKNVKSQSVLVI